MEKRLFLYGFSLIFAILFIITTIPISESAIPPTPAFRIINTTTGNITAFSYSDFVEFIAGSGMTITPNFATNEITFIASGSGLSEQYCTGEERFFAYNATLNSFVCLSVSGSNIDNIHSIENVTNSGCTLNQILKVNSSSIWDCAIASGGGGGSSSLGFSGAGATIAKGLTEFVGLNSGHVVSTEANGEFYVPFAATVENLYCFVSANASNNGGNTITVRHNGAGTTLQVTYAAAETGLKSDLVGTYSVSTGDRLSVQVVNTGSGGGTKNIVVETCTLELS